MSNDLTRHVNCTLKSYCLNGGICQEDKNGENRFCICNPGYLGSRCQDADAFAVNSSNNNRNDTSKDLQVWIPVSCIVVLSVLIAVYAIWKKWSSARNQQALENPERCIEHKPESKVQWDQFHPSSAEKCSPFNPFILSKIPANNNGTHIAVVNNPKSMDSKESPMSQSIQANGHICSGIDGQITIYLTQDNIAVLNQPPVDKKPEVTIVNEKQSNVEPPSSNSPTSYANESFVED